MANRIDFLLGFKTDKSGLEGAIAQLKEIQKLSTNDLLNIDSSKAEKALEDIKYAASEVENALRRSFDLKLNTVNIEKFNRELKDSGLSLQEIYDNFSAAGAQGEAAFKRVANSLLSTNAKLNKTQTILDKIGQTLLNTIKWNLASSVVNGFSNSVQEAYGYVKHLDSSLNDIRIVTQKSAEEMDVFAKKANTAAQSLGQTTNDYVEAALIYAQQGLSDEEIDARTEITLKAANVTQQSAQDVSEQLTAVWNGYQITAENAERSVDKLAAIAATTASNLQELATSMSKVAAAANLMGVSEDQLAAMLSTVITVTRQAPETAGTSFKTVFARISDIKQGIDEEYASLGKYSGELENFGIRILDINGEMRNLGDVFEETGDKWTSFTREQQINLAQIFGSQRQYATMLALFDNWDKYEDAIKTAANSLGALQTQQDIYMESTQAHLDGMSAALENVYDSFLNTDSVKTFADVVSVAANTIAGFLDSIGGGESLLLHLGSIATTVFSDQIANSITGVVSNLSGILDFSQSQGETRSISESLAEIEGLSEKTREFIEIKAQLSQNKDLFSAEELANYESAIEAMIQYEEEYGKFTNVLTEGNEILEKAGLSKEVKNIDDFVTQAKDSLMKGSDEIKTHSDIIVNALDDLVTKASENIKETGKAFDDLQDEIDLEGLPEDLQVFVDSFEEKFNSLIGTVSKAKISSTLGDSFKELKQQFDSLKETTDGIPGNMDKYKEILEKLPNLMVVFKAELETQAKKFTDVGKNAEETARSIRGFVESESILNNLKDAISRIDFKKTVKGTTELIGSLGQVAAGLNTLVNIPKIWDDENASLIEKLTKTLSGCSVALGQFISAWSRLNKTFNITSTLTKAINTGMAAYTAATGTATTATFSFTAAVKALGVALKSLPFSWIVAGIGAVVAGLASIAVWLSTTETKKLEELKKITEQASEAAEAMNKEYESFKELHLDYQDAVDGLEDLTEGTEEYAQAIEDANEKARELIETNKELAASASIDDNGLIYFTDEAALQNIEDKKKEQAKNSAIISAKENNELLLEEKKKDYDLGPIAGDDLETLIAAIKENGDRTDPAAILEALNNSNLLDENGMFAGEGGFISGEDLSEILYDNGLKDLITEIDSTNQNIEFNNKELVRTVQDQNETLAKVSNDTLSKIFEKISNSDTYKDKEDKAKQDYFSNKTTSELKELYADLTGGTFENNELKDAAGNVLSLNKDQLAEILSKIDTTNEIIENITEDIKNVRTESDKIEESTGVEGVSDDIFNFITSGGKSGSTLMIPDEKKEEVVNSLKEAIEGNLLGDEEFFQNLGFESGMAMLDGYAQAIEEVDFSQLYKNALANQEALKSAMDMVGDIDSFDDLKKKEDEYLTSLEDKYSSLAEARLQGLDAYKEELNNIMQSEEDAAAEAAREWKKSAEKELEDVKATINLDTGPASESLDDFLDTLQEVMDADYAIDLSIISDLETDTDIIVNQINDIADAISVIGEGWRVATDDLEIFKSKFPDLLVEAYDTFGMLADGSIQLSEQMVMSSISAAEGEVVATKAAAIERIDSEYQVLEAKKLAAQTALEATQATLQALQKDNIDAKTAMARADAAYLEYQNECDVQNAKSSSKLTEAETEDAETVDKEYATASNSMVDSSGKAAAAMEKNFASYTEVTLRNISKINSNYKNMLEDGASIELGAFSGGGYTYSAGASGSAKKQSGNTLSNADLTAGFRELENASMAELENLQKEAAIKALNNQITALEEQIANYTQGQADLIALKSQLSNAQSKLDDLKNTVGRPSSSGSSSNKKPSSGSSGSSETVKDPDVAEYLEEEADRYHDIDIEIKNIEKDLSKLEKQQKKLFGQDLIDNLNEQLEIIKKQVAAYERKNEIAQKEKNEIQAELMISGVTFDAYDQIANYTEAFNKALLEYNSVVDAYNKMTAEQQEETGKAMLEAAKLTYEEFKANIQRYDQLVNEIIPDLQESIQDSLDKELEINIQKFEMEIEARLDLSQAEKDWIEFKKKVIDQIKDDDFVGIIGSQFDELKTYFDNAGTGIGPIQSLTDHLNTTLKELQNMDAGLPSVFGDDKETGLNNLKEDLDELMKQMMEIEDLIEEIEQTYLDMIDKLGDAFDEQLDNFKRVDEIIEHNKNVINMLYGDKAFEAMDIYYQKQEENNLKQVEFLREEANFWKEKMDAEEEGSEAWKKYKENWEDAIGDLNSAVEDSITNLIDKYNNMIESIFDKLNNKVSNGLGLNYVGDEWDLINKNADEYLDTINRAYETEKLRKKFQDALDNNSGIQAQQKIKDLMDQQLGDLEQRDKLTQYDVERAEKLLEIELKKLTLQETQQNKSKMRLRRDSQGNYSYQFVSDEEQAKQAQEELLDLQNQLYNFDKDRYQSNLNDIYSLYNEFQEKLKELWNNTALSDEEREAQKTLLIQQYGELINAKTEQNLQIRLNLEESAFAQLAEMYQMNAEEFANMAEDERNTIMEGIIPYWNSGVQQMVDVFVGNGGFLPTCEDAFRELENTTQDYIDSLDKLQQAADVNFAAMAQGQSENLKLTEQMIDRTEKLINQYKKELDAVKEVKNEVSKLAAEYERVKNAAIAASEAAMKYWQEEQKRKAEAAAAEEAKRQEEANKNNSSTGTTTKPSTGGSSSSSNSTTSNKKFTSISELKKGQSVKFLGGTYYYDSYGSDPAGNQYAGQVLQVVNTANNKKQVALSKGDPNVQMNWVGWVTLDQIEKLKSGGYTGEWGDSGKLALLHQKELVLNADDTQNMLSAVAILRGLTEVLGSETLANLSTALDKIRTTPVPQETQQTEEVLEQKVEITATFPNVNNSKEIENAFNELINLSAQRRNRRGR